MLDSEIDALEQEVAEHEEGGEKPEKIPFRWYIVQVASGCENKVQSTLMQRAIALDAQDKIAEVAIPKQMGFKLDKGGKRQETTEKVFPGYVLIKMAMTDDSWLVVKSTPNVINFVGTEERRHHGRGRGHVTPKPLSHSELKRIFSQTEAEDVPLKIDMAVGAKIEVLTGPFQGFHGEVIEVSPERGKLKALISIFGRDTPVELEFGQVKKED